MRPSSAGSASNTIRAEERVTRVVGWALGLVLTFSTAALAQKVTKVPSGDKIVVSGIGEIRLAGIRSTDESAFSLGPQNGPPPTPPRRDPGTPPTPAVSAGIKLKPERPSRKFLEELVLGKVVRVENDPLATGDDERRAYVFLPDGALVNAEMLKQGKARVDLSHPFAHEEEFKRLESEARSAGLGIWAGVGPR